MDEFKHFLKEIRWLNADLSGKDFLLTWERSINEITQVLYTAEALHCLYKNNTAARCFISGLAVSIFKGKSSRSRLAFTAAANMLGLAVQELEGEKLELAALISALPEIIGISDITPGDGHRAMQEMAAGLDEDYKKGELNQRPGIINLGSDLDHPTRTLADLLYLKNHFGSLENLKNKKIAGAWIFSPKHSQSPALAQGIIALMTRFGMDVTLANTGGYNLMPEVLGLAEQNVVQGGGSFNLVDSGDKAVKDADIVFSQTWAPYCQPFITAALILNNRFPNPAGVLESLHRRNVERRGGMV